MHCAHGGASRWSQGGLCLRGKVGCLIKPAGSARQNKQLASACNALAFVSKERQHARPFRQQCAPANGAHARQCREGAGIDSPPVKAKGPGDSDKRVAPDHVHPRRLLPDCLRVRFGQ